jgi:hypothetical protein
LNLPIPVPVERGSGRYDSLTWRGGGLAERASAKLNAAAAMKEMADGCETLDASGWLVESITDRIV